MRDDPRNAGLSIDPQTNSVAAGTQVNVGSLLTLLGNPPQRRDLCGADMGTVRLLPHGQHSAHVRPAPGTWRAANIEYVLSTRRRRLAGTRPAPPEPALDCLLMSLVVEAKGLIDTMGTPNTITLAVA